MELLQQEDQAKLQELKAKRSKQKGISFQPSVSTVVKTRTKIEQKPNGPTEAEIQKYNKKLTARQLINHNYDTSSKDYKDILAECFHMRAKKMQQRTLQQQKKWDSIVQKDKNYIMNKKGYKHMLQDIVMAGSDMTKFKRGLSVFEDMHIKKSLTSDTAAPVLNDPQLSQSLQQVLFSSTNLGKGPKKSIATNVQHHMNSLQTDELMSAFTMSAGFNQRPKIQNQIEQPPSPYSIDGSRTLKDSIDKGEMSSLN